MTGNKKSDFLNSSIINITSVGGRTAFPMNSLYHATKFGLDGFSESLWYELKPFGIRVKVVAPGRRGHRLCRPLPANDARPRRRGQPLRRPGAQCAGRVQ
ncbi:hypothetical protein GCM10022408_24880 [Hymenobacter fastidiosus]|uniref:SDR family NAD(P)-dependent oxidoreductase n=1 Tax=Hymenobacter fastidiosus TaxID=486264 RepID=A0ABP7SH08_9BACT